MYKNIHLVLILVLFLNLIYTVYPQQKIKEKEKYTDIIPNYTELKIIHSKIVQDDYFLYIKLPKGYSDSDKTYPVIYLLDGDIAFTMAWSTVRYLQYGKDLPDVIIVGIGYGSLLSRNEENKRERDYTISKIDKLEGSGGGEDFLKFISNELIPFIEKEYRTSPNERVLNGYSLGGLFTIYTYLKENNLFSGYIAGSPYVSFDHNYLFKLLDENIEKVQNNKTVLFITYGEFEDKKEYAVPIEEIVNKIVELGVEKNRIQKRIFKYGTHFTCPSEALVYGLKFIFE